MTPSWRDRPIQTGTNEAPTHADAIKLQTTRAMELAHAMGIRRPTRAQADRIVTILAPCVPGLSIVDADGAVTIDGARWSPPRGGRPMSWSDEHLGGLNWAVQRLQTYGEIEGRPLSIRKAVERLRSELAAAGWAGKDLPSVRTFQNLLSIARGRNLWAPPASVTNGGADGTWGPVEE